MTWRDTGLTVLKIRPGSPPTMTTAWSAPLRGVGVQRKRISSAEVGVARVESLPIRRGKKIFFIVGSMQIRSESQDRLAIAPGRGRDEDSR
jgi:hypothetical protein